MRLIWKYSLQGLNGLPLSVANKRSEVDPRQIDFVNFLSCCKRVILEKNNSTLISPRAGAYFPALTLNQQKLN